MYKSEGRSNGRRLPEKSIGAWALIRGKESNAARDGSTSFPQTSSVSSGPLRRICSFSNASRLSETSGL